MPGVLIVYYSLSGKTRAAAETLRISLGADIVEIRDGRPRRGLRGMLRSVRESLTGAVPEIESDGHHPLAYKLVVLATPVWAARPASPMYAYIQRHKAILPEVAFLCTYGGVGAAATLARLAELVGKAPVTTLSLSDKDRKSGEARDAVGRFARRLRGAVKDAAPTGAGGNTQALFADKQR